MKFGILICLILLNPLPNSSPTEDTIPKELEGVWIISAVTDDGVDQPRAPHDSVSAGECADAEIVICNNRIVIIQKDGSSMACTAKVLTIEPTVKIEVVTGKYHDKDADRSYAILKRNGDELTLGQ